MRFKGKNVLVTGGSRGIGKAIAQHFKDEGAVVTIIDLEDPAYEVGFKKADIRVEKEVVEALSNIGKIDILVNNAGVYRQSKTEETSAEELDLIVDTNLKGAYIVTKHSLHALRESKGCIINISSGLAVQAEPESPAYCSTKAALIMLTKCWALEYAQYGMRVNSVLPGPIETAMLTDAFSTENELTEYARLNPMKRIGTPQEVARVVAFLASDEASYMNGALVAVDGGESVASAYAK